MEKLEFYMEGEAACKFRVREIAEAAAEAKRKFQRLVEGEEFPISRLVPEEFAEFSADAVEPEALRSEISRTHETPGIISVSRKDASFVVSLGRCRRLDKSHVPVAEISDLPDFAAVATDELDRPLGRLVLRVRAAAEAAPSDAARRLAALKLRAHAARVALHAEVTNLKQPRTLSSKH